MKKKTKTFKKDPHFLIDQPRTCSIFMLFCKKFIFFDQSGNQFSLYRVSLKGF